ncbi:hypothetical protein [Sulfurimonas sp.]|uniref:hypothetical protein n=1 Tax=Sulfurimonas sp. TaxID=2022749 RepID=UPI003D0A926B
MKKILISVIIGVLGYTTLNAQGTKLYDVKSANVTYKITGSSSMMGVQTQTSGEKSITFDNYGMQSVTKEKTTQKTTHNGTTQTSNTNTAVYMKDGIVYSVNYNKKTTNRMESMAGMMGGDMVAQGKAMLKQMGGEQIGTGKVLGYTCEIWEAMGSKLYFYKGVPLKTESNMMGVLHSEVATSVKFNTRVSASEFELPNFPVTDEMGNVINKNQRSKMDSQSKKDMQDAQKALQGFQNGDMLGTLKQQMLSQESVIRDARNCLSKAQNAQAAQRCMDKMPDSDDDEEMDDLSQGWDEQTKQNILSDMDVYLNQTIPCVKKVQKMADLDRCMK